MTSNLSRLRLLLCLAIATATVQVNDAAAQQPAAQAPGIRSSMVPDVDNLSTKFSGLAQAMAGKYDWRPGEGVRSVGEVFNLIVSENRMLLNALSPTPSANAQRPEPISDPAQLQEALRSSYASVRQAIDALPESDLGTAVRLFGRETTKLGAIYMVLVDQHEHLGQSIAYARTNGVTPPWSQAAR